VIPLRRPAADPLDLLLSRLEGVKKNGERYLACCPAHNDKSPSLSLARGDDGRALVRCWAGCETGDVLAAVGLEMRDLFSDNLSSEQRLEYRRKHLAKERQFERLVIEAAKGSGASLSDEDLARLSLAQERIDQLAAARGSSRAARGGGKPEPGVTAGQVRGSAVRAVPRS
jgi:hypothetical protein